VSAAAPVFARGLFGVLLCALWAGRAGRSLRPSSWTMLAARCGAGVFAVGCYYRALGPDGTDMVTAAMLLKTSPLWVALIAPFALSERPSRRTWIALALGLAGMFLVSVDPSKGWRPDLARLGVGLALIAGVFSAFAYISLRKLASTDDPLTVVFTFSGALALASAPFLVDDLGRLGEWSRRAWITLVVAGLFGTAGQLFLTAAYRYGTAAAVAIASLSEVGMQALLSWRWFDEVPSREALVGGLLAMGAGFLATPRPGPPRAPATTALPTGLVVGGTEDQPATPG
jgi:drug/metabolite transporter (DMT)-like permease